MTQAFAETVFGNEDPMGKLLQINNQEMEVVGIVENVRPDSHMQFDLLVSLKYLNPEDEGATQQQQFLETWGSISMVTYARLEPGASEAVVEEQLTALLAERSVMKTFSATLQPLDEAHLNSSEVLFDNFNQDK